MKTKSSLYRYLFLLAAPLLATACSDSEPTPQPAEVTFTTEVYTRANVINSLDDDSKLSVFYTLCTKDNTTSSGQTTFSQTGSSWKASTGGLYLKAQESLTLQACYPAVTGTAANAVAVSLAQQQDVLYSGAPVNVSYESPTAHLTMKHALCLFSFNLVRMEQTPSKEIKSIAVLNIPSQGTLDLSTGKIVTSHTGDYTLNVTKTLTTQGWSNELPGIFVLPGTPQSAQLSIQTDQGKFSCKLPDDAYEAGNQYIFHLVLSSNGLTLFKEDTKVVSLNQRDDAISTQNYGVLRLNHEGTDLTIPTFHASTSLSGLILWGDARSEEYTVGATHTYTSSDEHVVTIETWGAESVTFSNLSGISVIDLSDF